MPTIQYEYNKNIKISMIYLTYIVIKDLKRRINPSIRGFFVYKAQRISGRLKIYPIWRQSQCNDLNKIKAKYEKHKCKVCQP